MKPEKTFEKKTERQKAVEIPDVEERIVVAATTVYARTPFPYADLRSVAEEAGVETAEIKKHFHSPEDLYRVVLDRVMTAHRKAAMPTYMNWKAKGSVSRKEARDALCRKVGILIEAASRANRENGSWLKVYLWEILHPSPLYDEFYNKYFRENYTMITDLIMAATGSREFEKAVCQAVAIFGMCLGFLMEREFLVRYANGTGFSKSETRFLQKLVVRNTLSVLDLDTNDGE